MAMSIDACRSNQQVGLLLTPVPESGNGSAGKDQVSVATVIDNADGGDPVLIVSRPIDVEIREAVKDNGGSVVHLDGGAKLTYDPLVMFGPNSIQLQPSSLDNLTALATVLRRHPKSTVVIEGHTDNEGVPKQNQILSDERAKAVATFLASKDISAERISWKGYGDTQPLFSNKTSEGRKRNRRVEIVIIDKK